jgi:hypothetical protein
MAKKKKTDSTEDEVLEDDELEVDDESQDETEEDELDTEDEDTEETDDETEEDDDDEDEDSDEDEDEDEDDEDFKKRFTQFKGDDTDEYLKNLEDGYAESSKEAVRLSRELKPLKVELERITALIATQPELAKALQDGQSQQQSAQTTETTVNPALNWAETQMRQTWTKEFNTFAEKHPEIETDLQLAEQVDQQLAVLRDVIWQREKRQLGMAEGLDLAWKILGKDTNDDKEKVRMAAKASASQGKASGGKKSKEPKSKFSEAQITVAMDMMNVGRKEAIKRMSEHVK